MIGAKGWKTNRGTKTSIIFVIGLVFCFAFLGKFLLFPRNVLAANAPTIITYQGKLLVNNLAATTTQQIYFVLYNAASDGTVLYAASGTIASPNWTGVTPSNGLFSINIGDTGTNALDPAIFRDNAGLYLEVRIGAQTLTPRKRITASPFAYNAKYLDGVGSNTVSSSVYIPVSDSAGNFQFNNVTTTNVTTTFFTSNSTTTLAVSGGRVGIGTSTPTQKLEVDYGNLRFNQESAPTTAPTVAVNPAAGNLSGNYYYAITFTTADGETEAGPVSSVVSPANQQVDLSNIPLGSNKVISRKIYRATSTYFMMDISFRFVAAINNNTAQTYTDNIASSALGDYTNSINTTGGNIYLGSNRFLAGGNDTLALGVGAGRLGQGRYGTFLGTGTGSHITELGSRDTFIGYYAGNSNTTGTLNTYVGWGAGVSTTIGWSNTFLGAGAGWKNTTGDSGVIIGAFAGYNSNSGKDNTYVGWASGYGTNNVGGSTGSQNTVLGSAAGHNLTTGSQNSFLGMYSGYGNTTGATNTFIGYLSGYTNQTGNYNVFLGNQAGYYETGSNKLYISNSPSTTDPLIYGDFAGLKLGIGTNAPVEVLTVRGNGVFGNGSSSSTITNNSLAIAQQSGFNVGKFYVDSSGNVSASGTVSALTAIVTPSITLNGQLRTSWPMSGGSSWWATTTNNIVGYPDGLDSNYAIVIGGTATSTATKLEVIGNSTVRNGSILIADGTTTSTISKNSLILGQTSGFNVGKFYVDSSGNVTASGTVSTTLGAYFGGNVGIGTTTPQQKLHLASGTFLLDTPPTPSRIGGVSLSGSDPPLALQIVGKYAYLGAPTAVDNGQEFQIYDISNPASTTYIGGVDIGTSDVEGLMISGKYAYIGTNNATVNNEEFQIYDISNPASPVRVGGVDVDGDVNVYVASIYVSGRYAYIGTDNDSADQEFQIYDISNPASPVRVGGVEIGNGVSVGSLKVSSRYVYLGTSNATVNNEDFQIYDISNPANPVRVGGVDLSSGAVNTVEVLGKYAYLGTSKNTGNLQDFYIYDISNPTNPTYVSGVNLGAGTLNKLKISGKYAYLGTSNSTNNNDFVVYDISSSTAPAYVSGADITSSRVMSVEISGKYAYIGVQIADNGEEFQIFDIGGLDVTQILAGSIQADNLNIVQDVQARGLTIYNGANIANGINVSGNSSFYASTTLFMGGNVGIGTTNPSHKLTVVGNISADNGAVLSILGTNYLAIATSTTDMVGKFYVDSSGNVTASGTLNVYGTGTSTFGGNVSIPDGSAYRIGGVNMLYLIPDLNSIFVGNGGRISNDAANDSALGFEALFNDNSNGGDNSAVGYRALYSNTEGYNNVAIGVEALRSNTTGYYNSALGFNALYSNINGRQNVALGYRALFSNTSGESNVAVGTDSLYNNLSGTSNIAIGLSALTANIGGELNVAVGEAAGANYNATGSVFLGYQAGYNNQTGFNNIFLGYKAGFNETGSNKLYISNSPSTTDPLIYGDFAGLKLGIGTNAPTQALTVRGSGEFGGGSASSTITSSTLIIAQQSGFNVGKFYVDSSGNVNASGTLRANAVAAGGVAVGGFGASVYSSLYMGGNTGINWANGNASINESGWDLVFNNYTGVSLTEKMRIKSGGNVGIGTSSPYALLSVATTTVDLKDLFVIASSTTSGIVFKVDSYGGVFADGAYTSPASDYAEYFYTNDTDLVSGEVVCFDTALDNSVKRCATANSYDIAGVISTRPVVLGNDTAGGRENNPNYKQVGMLGQVPVKVTTVNGDIVKGDKLTSSATPGVAQKATVETKVIGTAMEDFAGEGVGVISIYLSLGWNNQLYKGLVINSDINKISVGSVASPYDLELTGALSFSDNSINKLSFATTSLFESGIGNLDGARAFIFNAINFASTSNNQYLLSLRANGDAIFSVKANGDMDTIGNIRAKGITLGEPGQPGDLAEKVDIALDDLVEAGDVLVIDPEAPDTYRRSSGSFEQSVAGVVSSNPTIIVGDGQTDYTANMAMVGRVKVKVTNENGAIKRGDILVTASTTGYAMKYDPAKDDGLKMVGVIGVALESFEGGLEDGNPPAAPLGEGGRGKILALIRTGWVYNRNQTLADLKQNMENMASAQGVNLAPAGTPENLGADVVNGRLVWNGDDLDMGGGNLVNVKSIASQDNKWKIDADGHFITRIKTANGEKEMFAMQSPTSEFVFSSSSQLMAGEANIIFAPEIQEIIDQNEPLKVTITLTSGEASGIFVKEKNVQGFVVKELQNGQSNATFDWMVVAKRKLTENEQMLIDQASAETGGGEVAPAESAPTVVPPAEVPGETTSSTSPVPAEIASSTPSVPPESPSQEITAPTVENPPASSNVETSVTPATPAAPEVVAE